MTIITIHQSKILLHHTKNNNMNKTIPDRLEENISTDYLIKGSISKIHKRLVKLYPKKIRLIKNVEKWAEMIVLRAHG